MSQILDKLLGMPGVAVIVLIYITVYILARVPRFRVVLGVSGKLNLKQVLWSLTGIICAAGAEELIFRLPLILVYEKVDESAWIGVAYSSFLFMLMHIPKDKGAFDKKIASESDSDLSPRVQTVIVRVVRVLSTLAVGASGVLYGYLAVKTQSILISWAAHILWNLVVLASPFILVGVTVAVTWVISIIPERRRNGF